MLGEKAWWRNMTSHESSLLGSLIGADWWPLPLPFSCAAGTRLRHVLPQFTVEELGYSAEVFVFVPKMRVLDAYIIAQRKDIARDYGRR